MVMHINQSQLPLSGGARVFEGEKFPPAGASFFLIDSAPGEGAPLHTHPYQEIFIVLEGRASYLVAGEKVEAGAGDILIAPAHVPHQFTNIGSGRLKAVHVHLSPKIIQENLA